MTRFGLRRSTREHPPRRTAPGRRMKEKTALAAVLILMGAGTAVPSTIVPADDPDIQYTGRWDFSDPKAPAHSWPGVYLTAVFEGTSVGVRLTDNFTWFDAFVDGGLKTVFHGTSASTASYPIATGLADGPHTLVLFKRNETTWARFAFNGLILDDGKGLLPPPERPGRRIEFIGDSFTSAEWNELTGAADSDAPVTNIYEGFGPIVGRHYGAEVHMTSISGWGLVVEWQGDYTKNLPDQFGQAHAFGRSQPWDFNRWAPNLVVIGLGLNDYNAFGGYGGTISDADRNLFIGRYHEFLSAIRDVYPGVKMLAVAANGLDWLKSAIGRVVAEENAAGHGDVFYADYPYYDGGYANYHPTVATHHLIADRLIAAIDGLNPWEPYDDTRPPSFTRLPASPFTAYTESVAIGAETDSYATVRWSGADKPWADMENTFSETGGRVHSTVVRAGHGGNHVLYLRASDPSGNAMDTSAVVRFDVDTTRAELDWTMPGYDDSAWKAGPAPVGNRAAANPATPAAVANTVYFRRTFDVPGSASVTRLTLMMRGGDGLIGRLNGAEAGRYNFPEGEPPRYGTAATKVAASGYTAIRIDASNGLGLLKDSGNVLAVEAHAAGGEGAGVSFDGQMRTDAGALPVVWGSEWRFFDAGREPENQVVDRIPAAAGNGRGAGEPAGFSLDGNFPNPFNRSTLFRYTLARRSGVRVEVTDLAGRRAAVCDEGVRDAGTHEFRWDAGRLPSGVYVVTLRAGDAGRSVTAVLIR
jgi:hypothetical protein